MIKKSEKKFQERFQKNLRKILNLRKEVLLKNKGYKKYKKKI